MQIERHEIRTFHAVVDAGGFSRAAERLGLSQSAVSQGVSSLEHKIGTQLLLRTSPPQLTEAGIRMLRFAETVIHEESAALQDIRQIRSGALSTLSLAMSSTVNRYFGRALLLDFCRENPLTRLKLDVAPSQELIEGVLDDRWEVGFGPFRSTMPGHLHTHVCFPEARQLVIGAAHARHAEAIRHPGKMLAEVPLLVSFLDDPGRRMGPGRLREAFASIWEVSHFDLRVALVQEGFGVTYVTDRVLADGAFANSLVPITGLDFSTIDREVGLYYKRGTPLSEGAKRFVNLCRQRWGFA